MRKLRCCVTNLGTTSNVHGARRKRCSLRHGCAGLACAHHRDDQAEHEEKELGHLLARMLRPQPSACRGGYCAHKKSTVCGTSLSTSKRRYEGEAGPTRRQPKAGRLYRAHLTLRACPIALCIAAAALTVLCSRRLYCDSTATLLRLYGYSLFVVVSWTRF